MFAVYHKFSSGRLEWIGAAETDGRARLLARMWSRYGSTDVIVVQNRAEGDTEHVYTYRAGHSAVVKEPTTH